MGWRQGKAVIRDIVARRAAYMYGLYQGRAVIYKCGGYIIRRMMGQQGLAAEQHLPGRVLVITVVMVVTELEAAWMEVDGMMEADEEPRFF